MATTTEPVQGATPAPAADMKAELVDRSQFIRTMAKDMAALAGTTSAPAPKKASEPVQKETETVGGVTLEKQQEPFFNRTQKEEPPQEVEVLPTMQEASAIVSAAPEPTLATPASVDAERAAVLERLRQKVGDSAQMSIQESPAPLKAEIPPVSTDKAWPDIPTPTPSFSAPTIPEPVPLVESIAPKAVMAPWANIPAPAPVGTPLAAPVIPPKETYREPIEAAAPPRPIAPDSFHTYTSDFAQRISTEKSSAFSVLAAEQDARTQTAPVLSARKGPPSRAVVMVASGILLLVLGAGGIFGVYQFVMTMRNTPIASITVPSIVFADEYRELEGTGNALLSELANTTNGALVSGNVLVTYILTSETDEKEGIITVPAGGDAFLRALQIPAPDILLRNIASESTIGAINAGGETNPFFALRVDSYERTYAGMLTWEPLMERDLALLFPLYPASQVEIQEPIVATSTATATSTASASSTPRFETRPQAAALTRFSDTIVANHDVRVLRDTNGKSLILYGYADKQTLLIVRDEAAFEALLGRLKGE